MSLTGKPTVVEPRAAGSTDPVPSLRPTQSAIASIRERLRLIEAEINAVAVRVLAIESGDLSDSTSDLQSQVAALRARVDLLEDESPTDWYVNSSFVGRRHRVDFRNGGNVRLSGADDPGNDQVIITFDTVTAIDIERGSLILGGRELAITGATSLFDVTRGRLGLRGLDVQLAGISTTLNVERSPLLMTGRDVSMQIVAFTLPVLRSSLALAGRNIILAEVFTFDFSDGDTSNFQLFGTSASHYVTSNLQYNLVTGTTSTSARSVVTPVGSFSDGYIEADLIRTSSTESNIGLFFRGGSNTATELQNGYLVQMIQDGSVRLYRNTAGAYSQIGSYSGGYLVGTPYRVRAQFRGSAIDVFVDGVNRISVADTNWVSGACGMRSFSNPIVAEIFDNLEVGVEAV